MILRWGMGGIDGWPSRPVFFVFFFFFFYLCFIVLFSMIPGFGSMRDMDWLIDYYYFLFPLIYMMVLTSKPFLRL